MTQQWPPQGNSDEPTEPSSYSEQGDAPASDAAPTAPLPTVTPSAAPGAAPIAPIPAMVRPTTAPPAPSPAPSWQIVEQPAAPKLGASSPSRNTGNRSLTPLVIGLVILLVLGGGAAIFALTRGGLAPSSATGTATPSGSSAFTAYTDADGVYTLSVPKTWLTTGNAALSTFGPASEAGVRVEIERLEVALNGQQDSVAGSFFDSAGSSANGSVANRSGATVVTLGTTKWSQYSGDLTVGATTEHIVLLIADHTGSTVIIATIAPQGSFASDDTQFFQPMLKSLAFLK